MSTLRPLTAFELFLQRRQQQAAADASGDAELRWTVNQSASIATDAARPPQPAATAVTTATAATPVVTAAAALPPAPAHTSATGASSPGGPPHPRPLALGALRPANGRTAPNNGGAAERPNSRQTRHRSAPDLVPQIVASLPSPRSAGATDAQHNSHAVAVPIGGTAAASPTAGGGNRPRPGPSTGTATSTAVYGELASAAASLASAASKLARGSQGDHSVAVSYENLAQAAADLAASACLIRPLTSSAGSTAAHGGANRRPSTNLPAKPAGALSNLGPLPRAVDPLATAPVAATALAEASGFSSNAAAAAAATALGGGKSTHPNHQLQAYQSPVQHPVRPSTGSSSALRRGLSVPRFSGYNPLIHLLESDLPPPGSATALRPTTSSPITHQLFDVRASLQSAAAGNTSAAVSHSSRRNARHSSGGSGAGSAFLPHYRRSSDGSGGFLNSGLQPGQLFRVPSTFSQVPDSQFPPSGFGAATGLVATAAAAAAAGGVGSRDIWFNDHMGSAPVFPSHSGGMWHRLGAGCGGGSEGGSAQRRSGEVLMGAESQLTLDLHPQSLQTLYADNTRLPDGSAPEPVTIAAADQDEVDARYNKVLAALRERVYTRGAGRLAAAFRDLDRDGSGMLSRWDFSAALQSMNLGPVGLIDEKVVDLMLAAVDGGGPGWRPLRVSYSDFVNALRFGTLPWRGCNRKMRHRFLADPDQPIGPPHSTSGMPPYSLVYGNNSSGGVVAGGPVVANAAAAATAAPAASGGHMGKLRLAFHAVDHNGDGVVEWEEFREALKRVGEQHRLQLSDQQLLKIYQDADPDFRTGVDYEAFMAAYDNGAGISTGATAAVATRLSDATLMSYLHGGGDSAATAMSFSAAAAGYAKRAMTSQKRHYDLPRIPPPPMTPMPPLPPAVPLTPLYDQLDQLRCTGSADGPPPRPHPLPGGHGSGSGAAGAERLRAPHVHWQLDSGGSWGAGGGASVGTRVPWWGAGTGASGAAAAGVGVNGYRSEALRDMHAGAAAVLRRLGSSGGMGRAAGRA